MQSHSFIYGNAAEWPALWAGHVEFPGGNPIQQGGNECRGFKSLNGGTFLYCIAFSLRLVVDFAYRGKPRPISAKIRSITESIRRLITHQKPTLFFSFQSLLLPEAVWINPSQNGPRSEKA